MWKENIDPLLSAAHNTAPDGSRARDSTAPAVLLLPPLGIFPVDALYTFTCPLLLPAWHSQVNTVKTLLSLTREAVEQANHSAYYKQDHAATVWGSG